MKLSEEELDRWFIELPLNDKKRYYRLWYDTYYDLTDSNNLEDLFICESNTPVKE